MRGFGRGCFNSEWLVNQHRDSYASYIGHHNMLSYIAVAENESLARVRFNMTEVRRRFPPVPAITADADRRIGLTGENTHRKCCNHVGRPSSAKTSSPARSHILVQLPY